MSTLLIVAILLILTYSFVDSYYFTSSWPEYEYSSVPNDTMETEIQHFHFNPNEVSVEEMQLLGFSKKLAERISNYREKGGRFYKPEDLYKIWGIDSQFVSELIPFIQLSSESSNSTFTKKEPSTRFNPKDYGDWGVLGQSGIAKVELNSANEEELMKLWGVKEKLAAKLVAYREQLGGFVHPYQLKEVFGIDSLFFQNNEYRISLDETNIIKININQADKEALQKHPYISWRMAETIVNYRAHHGNFKSPQDLEKILSLKKEELIRLKPYLSFQ